MDNSDKIIIDACAGSGEWSRPYRETGYDVRVLTLPENDVRLYSPPDNVYGVLAAPPCDEFSFAKHFHGKGKYSHNFIKGLEVVSACLRIIITSKPKFWALENPKGYLKNWLGDPELTFQPWWYGSSYQKTTCLWGEFNYPFRTVFEKPKEMIKFSMLKSKDIHPEFYGIMTRQERRAITPKEFAQAFFAQNL